jgi:4a-hydroxytetrahydrobiopterin dehydratase
MTATLTEKICTPCRGGIPPLTRDEAQRLQAQDPSWDLIDDTRRIERTFRFRNFREVLALFRMLVSLPRLKVITSTSVSAGVMRPSL